MYKVFNQSKLSAQSRLPAHKVPNQLILLAQSGLPALSQQSLAKVPVAFPLLAPPKGLIIQNTTQKTV